MQHTSVTVLAATALEYATLKVTLRGWDVVHAGIGLSRSPVISGPVIVAGVAGALVPGWEPGTVVVPHQVTDGTGDLRPCDPRLVSALTSAARSVGCTPRHDTLLTARRLVTGSERQLWAERGFPVCDMETALLPAHIECFAAIRVVLDTPQHSISARWAEDGRAMLDPRLWGELAWLATHAPRFALRAARITRVALRQIGPASDAGAISGR